MENMTDDVLVNISYPPISQQPAWIGSQVINIFLIVVDIFLILAVGRFGCRTKRFSRRGSDQSGGIVLITVFIAALLLLPRLLSNQFVILISLNHTDPTASFYCELAQDFANVTYGIAFLTVYVFLWIRQRLLYQQPSLSRLYNKVTKSLSLGCLVFLVIATCGIVTVFVFPHLTMESGQGCVFKGGSRITSTAGRFAAPAVFIVGQLVLLSLFVYPLYEHRNVVVQPVTTTNNRSRAQTSSVSSYKRTRELESLSSFPGSGDESDTDQKYENSSLSTPTRQPNRKTRNGEKLNEMINRKSIKDKKRRRSARTAKRVNRVIRRTAVCVVVCILCDLTANITVAFLLPLQLPAMLINTVYDINLVINVAALIVSFENYKRIFKSAIACGRIPRSHLPTSHESSKSSTSH